MPLQSNCPTYTLTGSTLLLKFKPTNVYFISLPLCLIFRPLPPHSFSYFQIPLCPQILRTSGTHVDGLTKPHCIPNSLYFSSQMIHLSFFSISRCFLKSNTPDTVTPESPHTPLFSRPMPLETLQLGPVCFGPPR